MLKTDFRENDVYPDFSDTDSTKHTTQQMTTKGRRTLVQIDVLAFVPTSVTSSVETPHGRPCACPYTDDVSTFALTRVRVRPDNRAVVRLHGRAVVRPEIVRQ